MRTDSLQAILSFNSLGHSRWWGAFICLVSSVVACGGTTEPVGSSKEPIATSDEPSEEPDAASDESQEQVELQSATFAELCALKEGGTFKADSMESFVDTVIGVWILCTPTSAFSHEPAEKGIEIAPGGTWYHLYGDSPATLERGLGFGKEGTYEVLDTTSFNGPGVYQLNLNISGSGGIGTMPQFTENASFMALNNNGVYYGEYRKL